MSGPVNRHQRFVQHFPKVHMEAPAAMLVDQAETVRALVAPADRAVRRSPTAHVNIEVSQDETWWQCRRCPVRISFSLRGSSGARAMAKLKRLAVEHQRACTLRP